MGGGGLGVSGKWPDGGSVGTEQWTGRFASIINGLGLAHQPRCVPGAAFGQAVLTYFQRGGGALPGT